jgi:hypothetical protein
MPGWDELEDPVPSDARDVQQGRDDLNKLVLRVFTSEDGAKLLEWLEQAYVDVPVAVPGADSSYAYYADGQRFVVRDIKARISIARKL